MPITPSLDLDAIAGPRKTVLIRTPDCPEGRLYEFRGEMELGVVEQYKLQTLYGQVMEVFSDDGFKDLAGAELFKRWMDEMLAMILYTPADAEVLAKLSDVKKLAIIQFFGEVSTSILAGTETTKPVKRRSQTRTSIGAE